MATCYAEYPNLLISSHIVRRDRTIFRSTGCAGQTPPVGATFLTGFPQVGHSLSPWLSTARGLLFTPDLHRVHRPVDDRLRDIGSMNNTAEVLIQRTGERKEMSNDQAG